MPEDAAPGSAIVVIPAFGHLALTHAVLADLAAERHIARPLVVDNSGDYEPLGDEVVLSPRVNLGWLRGSNAGLRRARELDPRAAVILLNNDTRLSRGFVAGLLAAAARRGVGAVGPCYDDHLAHMRCDYTGPAADYAPRKRDRVVPFLDGTCMLLTPRALDAARELAEDGFGDTGWGADIDLCVRVRQAGLRVVVTERSFLNHATASTAKTVYADDGAYWRRGDDDMRRGLERRYGPRWARVTGVSQGRRDRLTLRLRRGRL